MYGNYTSSIQFYRHPDWLGSGRLETTPTRTVYQDLAYAPYGEDYAKTGATYDLSFTGQTQDEISVTYDFLFRDYSAITGRWYSPDPAGLAAVDPTNPQSWNRYAYVTNTPVGAVDPFGLFGKYSDCGGCNPYMRSPGDKGGPILGATVVDSFDGTATATAVGSEIVPIGADGPDFIDSIILANTISLYSDSYSRSVTISSVSAGSGGGPGGGYIAFGGFDAPRVVRSRQQECVNNFHNTTAGKVVQVGSLVAMTPLDSEWAKNWEEFGKLFTVKTLIAIGENPVGVTVQVLAKRAGPPLIVAATATDAGVQVLCLAGAVQSLGAGW